MFTSIAAKYFTALSVTLGLLFVNYGDYWSAHWYTKWTYLLWVFTLFFGISVAKRTTYYFLPAILYVMGSGVWIFASVLNHYRGVPKLMTLSLERNTAYSVVAFAMFCTTVAWTHTSYKRAIKFSIVLTYLVAVLWTLASFKRIPYERGLLSGNASMQGCLIASLIPFVYHWFKSPMNKAMTVITGIVALYLLGAAVPMGVLAVSGMAYYVAVRRKVLAPAMVTLCLGVATYLLVDSSFVSDNGRFYRWKAIMHWWERFNPFIGAGFGTARSLLPYIQEMTNSRGGEYFIWMHSDWLQSYFELGIVGMACVLLGWVWLAVRSFNNSYLFATFMGFSASAVFDYPLRLPIHTAVLAFVVWLILIERGGI